MEKWKSTTHNLGDFRGLEFKEPRTEDGDLVALLSSGELEPPQGDPQTITLNHRGPNPAFDDTRMC